MKFAKHLQQEMHQEWNASYVDYKMMKKVLKLQENIPSIFSQTLESQLIKVRAFMQEEHAVISENICLLGKAPIKWNERLEMSPDGLHQCCENIVQRIELFRDYAELNQTAIRKIIKKFDKRFQARFRETFGVPSEAKRWVSKEDISVWLLNPAQHCFELMKRLGQGSSQGLLRQLAFWVEELQTGAELAKQRIGGTLQSGPTPLRLERLGYIPKELSFRVRHTFIECVQRQQDPVHRASSQPLRCSSSSIENHPLCDAGMMARNRGLGTPEEKCSARPKTGRRVQSRQQVQQLRVGTSANLAEATCPTAERQPAAVCPAKDESRQGPKTPARARGRPPAAAADATPVLGCGSPARRSAAAPLHLMGDGFGSRWWTEVNEVCPLSGFPVHLLPYPPFKFHLHSKGASDAAQLIDGPFMVLKVLTTWRFEVLGRPLTPVDIRAIDAYMKRCKLGPFRLGRAMELVGQGTAEARRELEALQDRAFRKLEALRHIQRVRLRRRGAAGGRAAARA